MLIKETLLFSTFLCIVIHSEKLHMYYDSDIAKQFEKIWISYKLPYELALTKSIQETFGRTSISVEKKDYDNHLLMTKAYYVRDDGGLVFFKNLRMASLPRLQSVFIDLNPASMVMDFEAVLERTILMSEYNLHEINVKQKNNSPFTRNRASNEGFVSIIAENCLLSGRGLIVVDDAALVLRHHDIGVKGCDFSVEITNYSSPPIIMKYFTRKQGMRIERFMNIPLREELTTHLNGAFFTMFNLASLSPNLISSVSKAQQKVIYDVQSDLDRTINTINELSKKEKLEFKTTLNFYALQKYSFIMNLEVIVRFSGTLFSTHTGGSYRHKSKVYVTEKLGFSDVLVSGLLKVNSETKNLIIEINDLTTDVTINNGKAKVYVNFWKTNAISITPPYNITTPHINNVLLGFLYSILPDIVEGLVTDSINEIEKNNNDVVTITTFDICNTKSTTPVDSDKSEYGGYNEYNNNIEDKENNKGVVNAKVHIKDNKLIEGFD